MLALILVSFRGTMTGAPLVQFIVSWLTIFVLIRRLHDMGLSGWWVIGLILMLVAATAVASDPLLGEMTRLFATAVPSLVLLAFGLIPGQRFAGRFGPPPTWPRVGGRRTA